MAQVAFGLGSNVGDAARSVQEAVTLLGEFVSLEKASSLYASSPMYKLDQAPFVNAAVTGETSLGPNGLLNKVKEVEERMGRVERERNGPREIDIDILVYGHVSYRLFCGGSLRLQIPHPRLSERRFVLLPLFEIAPTLFIPDVGQPIQLLPLTESQSKDVTRIEDEILSIHRTR